MPDSVAALPSTWLAALLLLARSIAERLELPCPTAAAIVKATGASKSRAYEVLATLTAILPTLVRAPGDRRASHHRLRWRGRWGTQSSLAPR